MRRSRLARTVALLAALVAPGCRHGKAAPAPPRLVEIKVIDRGEGEAGAVDAAALARRAGGLLGGVRGLTVALGEPPVAGVDWRLTLEVAVAAGSSGDEGALRAAVEATLRRIGGPGGEEAIRARGLAERAIRHGELSPATRAALLRAHAERAVEDVVRQLAAEARVHFGSTDELLAALRPSDGGADDEVLGEAIRVAVERREKAATPALVELLRSGDPELRDQAIGALAEIGDHRAVKPLTEAAHFGDVGELPKVIDALGAIGGDEARAWLQFVADGHDDPSTCDLAREALDRLDRRAAAQEHPRSSDRP